MARRPTAGISGLAVAFGATGIYLVYAGLNGVPLVDGLRDLLQGRKPAGTTKPFTPVALTAPTSPEGAGIESAGGGLSIVSVVIPESLTTVIPGTSIRVATSIAPRVSMMVAAARTQGITLDGYGWRSVEQTRKLRAEHGYTSDDQAPGSGGRTPVARPGTSMHERGLAIDFKGMTEGDPANRWLHANAARYGFSARVPGEPWHWSTTGH